MINSLFIDSQEVYLKQIDKKLISIYWIILSIFFLTLSSLPFIYFDITVKSPAIIRPSSERTEVKPIIAGIIETVFYHEGQTVLKNSVIVQLRDNNSLSKKILNNYEHTQRRLYIHDLKLLTDSDNITSSILTALQSPIYKQQISRFLYQRAEQEAQISKVGKEMEINDILIKDKVIASKEHFDKEVENQKLQAAYSAFKTEQTSIWQQDLAKYRLEIAQLKSQQKQLHEEQGLYEIVAPISGTIQGINTRYAGGTIQTGETICIISPETDLIAECYISTQDIGLLNQNQGVKFTVEAFDYNYFGTLIGKIESIDNDFTMMDNKPTFKVRCSFKSTELYLKNGYTAQLKKGLTLQARFMVARRSLWQLLFDNIDNWLNPAAPTKNH